MGRTRTVTTSVAAAFALIAAGCSSGGSAEGGESAPQSPTTNEATMEEWASLVAQEQVAYDETQESWDDATCSSLAAAEGAVDCQAMMITMGYVGDAASIVFWDATNPDAEAYLGEPPAEIADLVEETAAAADDVSFRGGDVDMDCFEGDCTGPAFELERTWDALGEAYAGWKPYL